MTERVGRHATRLAAAQQEVEAWVGTNGVGRCNGKGAAQLQRR